MFAEIKSKGRTYLAASGFATAMRCEMCYADMHKLCYRMLYVEAVLGQHAHHLLMPTIRSRPYSPFTVVGSSHVR